MSNKTVSWYQMLFKSRSKSAKKGSTKKRHTKKGGYRYNKSRNTRRANTNIIRLSRSKSQIKY